MITKGVTVYDLLADTSEFSGGWADGGTLLVFAMQILVLLLTVWLVVFKPQKKGKIDRAKEQ